VHRAPRQNGRPVCENARDQRTRATSAEKLMSTYLITGIAGFIGSSLARAVLQRGDRVRGIDNFSTGKPENIAEIIDQVDFREADLVDLEATQQACRDVDYVLHEAAIPSVPRSINKPLKPTAPTLMGP
jgi:nucleoside-diphosphate-sugar epimerase